MKTTILIMLSLALVLSTKAQSNQKAVKSKVGPDIVAYQEAGSLAQGQNQPKRKRQRRGGRGGSDPGRGGERPAQQPLLELLPDDSRQLGNLPLDKVRLLAEACSFGDRVD